MIIKDTLRNVQLDGDNMVFNHVANVEQELKNARDFRKDGQGNWTNDREMRLIGSIPELVYHKLSKERPEVVKDARLLKKWLGTDEGKLWATNTALDTGNTGHIIIK